MAANSIINLVDVDFDSGNYRYLTRERYVFGWTDYKGLYGSGN